MHQAYLICFLCLFPVFISAASIYKWVDGDGQVQFSHQPPNQKSSQVVGTTAPSSLTLDTIFNFGNEEHLCKEDANLLEGDWVGEFNAEKIKISLRSKSRRKDETRFRRNYRIYLNEKFIQSGAWTLYGNRIKLLIKKTGSDFKYSKFIKEALVVNASRLDLYLLLNGTESARLSRGYFSVPRCMRNKR